MCETCGTWSCSQCGYGHYTMNPKQNDWPQCDRCGHIDPRSASTTMTEVFNAIYERWAANEQPDGSVTYEEIQQSPAHTTFIDETGEYWSREEVVEQMDVAGYPDPSITWIQFYEVQA